MTTIDQRQKRQTYWDSGRMSPALQRARLPFRAKNLMMGAGILTFTFGVYMYSIAAVKQDDFSDIPAPSLEKIQQINRENEQRIQEEQAALRTASDLLVSTRPASSLPPIGLLGSTASWLRGRNSSSEIIPGAPPVDRIGKIDDRQVVQHDRKLV
ncbi:hypothetical protein PGT21_031595 [Puccinia graminis f. sp. tritici]|uniref:Cytochrome c oxidase assembly factor 3 n=1 Tax=Puccinia graminis f. sp. tritici TaxID=56615 RepID=A0A5B0M8W5_PUCGR|nr:hypothetical protein PGT21_031595 [Puccinia graminis f. sp. tritici]KAA1086311.1 hypothetical protein PGTUg99_009495 [Puccinia graminis f. sp. tritici]